MIKKLLLAFCLWPFLCIAQTPIQLVVPFAVGGPADQIARVVQQTLSRELNRPVVITYKIGGGGAVANSYVAERSQNETVLLIQSSALASNAALTPSAGHNNLVPLTYLGTKPILLAVSQKSQLGNFKAWQNLNNKKAINIGSGEFGTNTYFHNAIFQHNMQKNLLAVPYKGQGQLMPDLVAGHVDGAFVFVSQALPFIKANQLLPVAVASPRRLDELPNTPTFEELGMKNMDYYTWFILLTNQNLSTEEQKKIQTAMIKILNNAADREQFTQTGLQLNPQMINQAFVLKEIHRYQEIVKNLNLKPN